MSQLQVGAAVQYFSTSHGCWIDAVVDAVRESGEVQVSCKKGYWMPLSELAQRLRPAAALPKRGNGAGADSEPLAGARSPKAVVILEENSPMQSPKESPSASPARGVYPKSVVAEPKLHKLHAVPEEGGQPPAPEAGGVPGKGAGKGERLQALAGQAGAPGGWPRAGAASGTPSEASAKGGNLPFAPSCGPSKAPSAATASAAGVEPAGDWAADQAIGLGAHGAEDIGAWVKVLDRKAISSVHAAVEKLTQGELHCEVSDFCIVYSSSSAGYYLLYRRGCREKALAQLMQHLREVTANAALNKEELRKLQSEAQSLREKIRQARCKDVEPRTDAKAIDEASRQARPLSASVDVEKAWRSRLTEAQGAMEEMRKELAEAREQLASAERERARLAVEQQREKERRMLEQGEQEQSEQAVAALRAELQEEQQQLKILEQERDALLEKAEKSITSSFVGTSAENLSNFLQAAEEELSLQTALEEERSARLLLEEALAREGAMREALEAQLASAAGQLPASQAASREEGLSEDLGEGGGYQTEEPSLDGEAGDEEATTDGQTASGVTASGVTAQTPDTTAVNPLLVIPAMGEAPCEVVSFFPGGQAVPMEEEEGEPAGKKPTDDHVASGESPRWPA